MVLGIISDERALKSKSPAMHNAVMRRHGIRGTYVPFQVRPDRVGDAVRGLPALGITGVNVTVPYKESVMPHLDELSVEAEAIGAVNTIACREGRLIGFNTDAAGFADTLFEAGFEAGERGAIVVGTGGAAKAVLWVLREAGARPLLLAGRDARRTAELAGTVTAEAIALDDLPRRVGEAELLVNATTASSRAESADLADRASGLDGSGLKLVLDLNYGRSDNFWQILARKHRAVFMDGLAMLAHQARRSFAIWTGRDLGPDDFKAGLREDS